MPDDPDEREEAPSDDPADTAAADTAAADTVEEADKESFPASDPPASWAGDDGV
jgi:hypothetical protein